MSIEWAVRFPRVELSQIGRLWSVAGVEVCEQPDTVWLRGPNYADDAVQSILRGLLSGQRLRVLADGQIQSPKSLVPTGHLPAGPWQPLRDWMTVSAPTAALAGQSENKVRLTLVRCDLVQDPGALLAQMADWLRYGEQAPAVRLERSRFAMSTSGEVLIQGQPLPSLPGHRFVVTEQIAVPAGWTWSPHVDGAVLSQLLRLKPGDLAVFQLDGSWFPVRAGSFVKATRQTIRASAEHVVHG